MLRFGGVLLGLLAPAILWAVGGSIALAILLAAVAYPCLSYAGTSQFLRAEVALSIPGSVKGS